MAFSVLPSRKRRRGVGEDADDNSRRSGESSRTSSAAVTQQVAEGDAGDGDAPPALPMSPQPPRVLTAQDRKRALLARRSGGGKSSGSQKRAGSFLRTNSVGGGGARGAADRAAEGGVPATIGDVGGGRDQKRLKRWASLPAAGARAAGPRSDGGVPSDGGASSRDGSTSRLSSRSGSRSLFSRLGGGGGGSRSRSQLRGGAASSSSKLATVDETSSASASKRGQRDSSKAKVGALSPSLFGAVMSRTGGTPQSSRRRPSSFAPSASAAPPPAAGDVGASTSALLSSQPQQPATPGRPSLGASSDGTNSRVSFDPRTPLRNAEDSSSRFSSTRSPSSFLLSPSGASASNLSARSLSRSPGGAHMQRILEGVNSAFHYEEQDGGVHEHDGEDARPRSDSVDLRGTNSAEDGGDSVRDRGWYETHVAFPPEVGFEAGRPTGGQILTPGALAIPTQSPTRVVVPPPPMPSASSAGVGIIDWSLKRRLRIEAMPGRCLPGSSSRGGDEWKVESLARDMFINPVQSHSQSGDEDGEVLVAARWKAATMYWQHPEVYPLSSTALAEAGISGGRSARPEGGKRGQFDRVEETRAAASNPALASAPRALPSSKPLSSEERQINALREARSVATRRVRTSYAGPFGSSRGPSSTEQRRREWRDAFRSLFLSWLGEIDAARRTAMRTQHASLTPDDDFADPASASAASAEEGHGDERLRRACFYALGTDMAVLFRASDSGSRRAAGRGNSDGDSAGTATSSAAVIEPTIALSSTTPELRSALRSMDVRLFALDPAWDREPTASDAAPDDDDDDEDREFCERRLDEMTRPEGPGEREREEAAEAMEELEALRRVTVQGNAVGAEISVSVAKGAGKGGKSKGQPVVEKVVSALCLRGDEHCMAFFELYLNSCGGTLTTRSEDSVSDVPLLLSRMPHGAPCNRMSLRTLAVGRRRDDCYWRLQRHRDLGARAGIPAEPDDPPTSYMEMVGPILPSAAREMLTCAASLLMTDSIKEERKMRGSDDAARGASEEKKDDGGSRGHDDDGDSRHSTATEVMVGSHYLVAMCDVLKGPRNATSTPNQSSSSRNATAATTGIPGSAYFNAGPEHRAVAGRDGSQSGASAGSSTLECGGGDVFTMGVWNLNNPTRFTFRTESVNPPL